MNKSTQQTSFKLAGLISKSPLLLVTGIFFGIMLSACSSGGSSKAYSAQSNRSPEMQRQLQLEQAADDQRDHEDQLKEQSRSENVYMNAIRANRAAQRNLRNTEAELQK
jgi:hypothetical protein